MATTKNATVTMHQASRDHGTRTATKTTGVIVRVRSWARRCDDRLHRRRRGNAARFDD